MAENSNITASDDWFDGEDKVLQITVTGTNITSWNLRWDLYNADDVLILSKTNPSSGISVTSAASGISQITVASTDVAAAGNYCYKFWRTDVGTITVLAFGDVVIRSAC